MYYLNKKLPFSLKVNEMNEQNKTLSLLLTYDST